MRLLRPFLCCAVRLLLVISTLSAFAHSQTVVTAAVGDVNGDGKPDVIAWNGSALAVLLNDGAGHLTAAHFLIIGARAASIALADLNNDGHLDIVVGEFNIPNQAVECCTNYEILLGDGTGAFSAPKPFPTVDGIGDFNGDGLLDVAAFVRQSFLPVFPLDLEILPGNGQGGRGAPVTFPFVVRSTGTGGRVLVVDANHDGKPDLLLGAGYVGLNNGNGFTVHSLALINNRSLTSFGCLEPLPADLNGDGNIDFLCDQSILFGDGQGGFLYAQRNPFPGGLSATSFFLADFDNNGTTDVLMGQTPAGIQYLPGNGHGGFGDLITISPSKSFLIAVVDLNEDGFPDLVAQDPTNLGNISVILNPGITPVSIAASSQTQISASAATASTAAPVTLIASVASLNAGFPHGTGTVTFTDGTTTLGTAPVNIYGIAALDFTFPAGAHSLLNGSFGGTVDTTTKIQFAASTSTTPAAVGVNPTAPTGAASQVTLATSLSPQRELNDVTFTATVTPSSASAFDPTGNVVFRADGNVMGISPLVGRTAQFIESFFSPGLHNITASYGGDGLFPPAVSATVVEDIRAFSAPRTPGNVQLTLSPPGPVPADGTVGVTFTASLNGDQRPPAFFTYRINNAFWATDPFGNDISAPPFVPSLPGTYTITAEYAGDAVTAPSTAMATLVVGNPSGDFVLSSSAKNLVLAAGQTGTLTLTVTPANGLHSPVSFSCSGLPQGASCAFSPATLIPNSTPESIALTISTTARQSTVAAATGLHCTLRRWALAMCFGLGVVLIGSFPQRFKWMKILQMSAVVTLLLLISSCGSGRTGTLPPQNTGTPAGTTQITVSATSAVTHTMSIGLTVQ